MRALLRVFLVLALVAVAAFLVFGFWAGRYSTKALQPDSLNSPSAQKARERGAELGEKEAAAAAKAQETVAEAALTTKIKAKMGLDDSVKARTIDVTTTGSVVTLTGTVESKAEHDRAVALARETAGVTQVVDHMRMQR